MRPNILWGLIWIKIVCKSHQWSTKSLSRLLNYEWSDLSLLHLPMDFSASTVASSIRLKVKASLGEICIESRAPDQVLKFTLIDSTCVFPLPNPMFDHLSVTNKWSNIGFGEEICIIAIKIQSTLDISNLWGLFFTSSNYLKCKFICTSGNLDL